MGTKLGSKPGGKKPYKPLNNAEKKSRSMGGAGSKEEHKFPSSKAGMGPQKRTMQFKAKNEESEGKNNIFFSRLNTSWSDNDVSLHISWLDISLLLNILTS